MRISLCDRCSACIMPGAQAGRVAMRLWMSFLNNSSSRWEPIWENWPLHMELIDIVSPIYRSDFQRSGTVPWTADQGTCCVCCHGSSHPG